MTSRGLFVTLVLGTALTAIGCGGGNGGDNDGGTQSETLTDIGAEETTPEDSGEDGTQSQGDSSTQDSPLGDDTESPSDTATQDGESDTGTSTDEKLVLDVVAGFGHTCAIAEDKEIYCFGANQGGQIGNGKKMAVKNVTTPTRILESGPWRKVTAGTYHTCAIKEEGTLWCWGGNAQGQLGLGDFSDHPTPTQVGTATWIDVSGHNFEHTCGVQTDGSLWCWGDNTMGQLGNGNSGSSADQKVPSFVAEGPFTHVATGGAHTCAIDQNGTLWCFGANHNGRLGLGAPDPGQDPPVEPLPQLVGQGYATVEAGGGMTCAIEVDGGLVCFGMNNLGQVGVGDQAVGIDQTTPTPVGESAWLAVSGGGSHACGVEQGGALFCWGSNEYGQLGVGTSGKGVFHSAPVKVGTDEYSAVSTGGDHSCAVRADGALVCFGLNYKGQLGQGIANATPVTEPVRVVIR